MKLIVNFKNYEMASGKKALELAKLLSKYSNKFDIMVAVQNLDVYRISRKVKIKIMGQYVDAIKYGRNTGFSLPETLKFNGAWGSLINHSEHRINFEEIKYIVKKFKQLKLKSIVCVQNLEEAKKVKKLKPDLIAFEDGKLIGTGKSIATYDNKPVKEFLRIIPNGIIGAGISSKKDIEESLNLGAKGVLIASAIANVKNPKKKLKEILG